MAIKRFSVLGGDLRSLKLADLIKKNAPEVYIFGHEKSCIQTDALIVKSLDFAVGNSDIVIGPVPCSPDDENLNAPFHEGKIPINEIFRMMGKNQIFMAGRISSKIMQLANVYNVTIFDLLEREELSVLNSIPTAEGAIQLSMEEMAITLHNCNALVTGFGRIGKILAKMLYGIGANVYAEARRYEDLAWIKSYGYIPVHLNNLKSILPQMDVIFNTIPYIIFNEGLLLLIKNECLIIDLASKPGGVDFEKAKILGKKVIWALSLPGKVAPVTAAGFIKDTVFNIIDELGV